ncbi:hypothetical protein [Pontibacter sp. SGAir0037]|uniref:hypothetical protein n=1 Tax=Pontibacter sp. SGAir0037 TaxID=2571030 RepID=UPI0010CD25F6|nr:hypothetical protein [Pontibacter sp. SGAir0037]QCR23779.1 hypothetical protein C1N53_16435 [Pontibacter sp. SGAir0037]
MSKEDLKIDFKHYSDQLRSGLLKAHEQYEKTLILISSGGLVLSMALMEKIVGNNPINIEYLVTPWIFLGLTLLLSLASTIWSIHVHTVVERSWVKVSNEYSNLDFNDHEETLSAKDRLKKLRQIEQSSDEVMEMFRSHYDLTKRFDDNSNFTTYAPLITLLVGVCSLIYFSSTNVLNPQKNDQTTSTQTSTAKTERTQTRDQRDTITATAQDTNTTIKAQKVDIKAPPQ